VIIQVCASGGLKRASNSLAPASRLRRNQVALASHALGADRPETCIRRIPDSPAAFLESSRAIPAPGFDLAPSNRRP